MPAVKILQKKLSRKRTRRQMIRIGLVAGNVVILAVVFLFVLVGPGSNKGDSQSVVGAMIANNTESSVNPIDQLAAMSIAQTASTMAGLPETSLVNGQLVAETVQLNTGITSDGTDLLTKQQVVKSDFKSNKDIKTYTVVAGDSVLSIATKFGLSSNSVKWSNDISGNDVAVGTKLLIPPVDGIVYTVKGGDTPTTLAQTYNTSKDLIVAYNDAEINGIQPGEVIIIPGGQKPSATNYLGISYGYGYGVYGVSGNYNMYAYNNCTWWVALRWAQTGRPTRPLLGNASSWYYMAEQLGLPHGTTPQVHAAAVTSTRGWGHVVFVESINSDGSINISEMNVDGAASSRVWYSTRSAEEASHYLYVY